MLQVYRLALAVGDSAHNPASMKNQRECEP
jgi:hypothetical protein